MTIGSRILAGFTAAACFTLAVAATGLYVLQTTEQSYRNFVDKDQAILMSVLKLRVGVMKQGEAFTRYLQSGDQAALEAWNSGNELFKRTAEQLQGMLDDTATLELLGEAYTTANQLYQVQQNIITAQREGSIDTATAFAQEDVVRLRNSLMLQLPLIEDRQAAHLEDERRALGRKTTVAVSTMIAASVIALLVLLAVGALVTRSVARQLNRAIRQISGATSEITGMTSQVAASTAQTASAVSQATVTAEEVKQTAKHSSEKARQVLDNAQRIASVAEAGKKAIQENTKGLSHARVDMETIRHNVFNLAQQTETVGQIIDSVNELSERSTVLSINAAIEASKAGEFGKGFNVVAKEIAHLAERSKEATLEVRNVLLDTQNATRVALNSAEQGIRGVLEAEAQAQEAGRVISALSASIAEAGQSATQIAATSQQQLAGMDQIVIAMTNIRQACTQNMEGTTQSELAARGLSDLAAQMRQMVESNGKSNGAL